MTDMMADVISGIDSIFGESKDRVVNARIKCENPACYRGFVEVDHGMGWQSQPCPECHGRCTVPARSVGK